MAAGWLVGGAPRAAPVFAREAIVFGLLGAAADIDLLTAAHRGPTHGIGAAFLVGIATFPFLPGSASWNRLWTALACAAAYGSHIVLDWLGADTAAPVGIMALWPFSRDYFVAAHPVFLSVTREYWRGEYFWRGNLIAVTRELLLLVPLAIAVAVFRRR